MNKKIKQPLGEILQEANLVTFYQVETALTEQKRHPKLRLGEIMAQNGWLKQKTADFFAERWFNLIGRIEPDSRKPFGYYLQEAGLLDESQLQTILWEQSQGTLWVRVGALAVLKGWLNQSTVDFLVEHLYPERAGDSPFLKAKN